MELKLLFVFYIKTFIVNNRMILYNKTILLPNLDALNDVLVNDENPNLYACNCVYADRIAIQHQIQKGMHNIRIWRTKTLFDYWFNDFHYSGRNFIASLDYTIHKDYIKIEHLGINDREPVNLRLYDNSFDDDDAEDIIKYLIILVLLIVAFSTLYLIYLLYQINDNSIENKLAKAGMIYFFIHAFFFDSLLWTYNFMII